MKILTLLTRGDSIGGAQTHVVNISKMLKDNGDDVVVVFGGEAQPLVALLEAENIRYVSIKHLKREISILNDIRSVYSFLKIIKKINPDVITLHSSKAGIIGRLCRIFIKKPIIFTVHGWAFTDGVGRYKVFFYRLVEKLLAPLADKIIVVSEFDRRLALESKIVKAKNIVRIYNGIAVNINSKIIRSDCEFINLIMIARFDSQKDHGTLLKACKDIQNIKLNLLGDGPQLNNAKEMVKRLNMESKVVFWGYTKDVNNALCNSDIFLLISNWEGFPISTLEAMNNGLPVIISDAGGAGEAVEDGVTGFILRSNDSLMLKNKIEQLIDDVGLRKRMGEESKRLLIRRFSDVEMFNNTYSVYKNLINYNK